ncbi:MAG: WD40 repeat domain-containing protein [bacterium]
MSRTRHLHRATFVWTIRLSVGFLGLTTTLGGFAETGGVSVVGGSRLCCAPFSGTYPAVFSPDGRYALTFDEIYTNAQTATVWDTGTKEAIHTFVSQNGSTEMLSVIFSADGKQVLMADDAGVEIWDIATGMQSAGFAFSGEANAYQPSTAHFSPDASLLLTAMGSEKGSVWLWDANTGERICVLRSEDENSRSPRGFYPYLTAFSPGGEFLLTGSTCEKVRLWDAKTGELLHFTDFGMSHEILLLSPDGRHVLIGGMGFDVHFFDVSTWTEIGKMSPESFSFSGALLQDGQGFRIMEIDDDGIVRMWDAATGEMKCTYTIGLLEPTRNYWDTVFSPDGKYLLVTEHLRREYRTRLLDAGTGEEIHLFENTESPASAAFSSDGSKLLMQYDVPGYDDLSVEIFDISGLYNPSGVGSFGGYR